MAEQCGPYTGPHFAISLRIFRNGGDVPVVVDTQTVGAIGVGGTRAPSGDEDCAQVGIDDNREPKRLDV